MTDQAPTSVTYATIDKDLQDSLAALAHKHVHISYALIGVILLILALCSVGAYFGNKSWQKAMENAETAEKQMVADRAQYQQTLASMQKQIDTNNQHIAADQAREQSLINQINKRDAAANKTITNVLQPGKSATDAYADVATAYRGIASFTQDIISDPATSEPLLAFPIPAVQHFTAAELAELRDSKDLADTQGQLAAERDKTANLTANFTNSTETLAKLQATEAQCEQTVADYKKVAKKSRFRKIMDGAIKVAIFAAGIAIGHQL
jgi:septal ring factor EnvC (AmiA/AmiB activator)